MKLNKKTKRLLLAVVVLFLLFSALRDKLAPSETGPAAPSQTEAPLTVLPAPGDSSLTVLPTPSDSSPAGLPAPEAPAESGTLAEDGSYTTKEDLVLYLRTYGHLPPNFITKDEARAAGWEGGNLEKYCPGKCIGGDRFMNREGQLPAVKGRVWTECDVNTLGARSRGAERLVFSNDGLIYYTSDHYESFTPIP